MFNEEINERVKAYLAEHNLTQKELAKMMGIFDTDLSNLLSNQKNWSLARLALLAKCTGISFTIGQEGLEGD